MFNATTWLGLPMSISA